MKELNEKDLELIVKEKNLGSLITNAKSIKKAVEQVLPNYDASNYSIENIEKAEKDKAMLNTTAKNLNKRRIDLEKEFMVPFNEFKTEITETCNLIKEASEKINVIVQTKEQERKDIKKADIETYFEDNIGSLKGLIDLEKIFNDRWLNKGYEMEDIQQEIAELFKKTKEDLTTIESLKSKYEVELKNNYLTTLDLSTAIKLNNELLEKEEKLVEQTKLAEIEKVKQEEKQLKEQSTTKVETNVIDPVETYALKITGKRSQMVALREFLNTNNMTFEKVE